MADVSIARKVIAFLEDRRVLFSPSDIEVPQHVFMSVIEIRHFLTDVIAAGGLGTELEQHLRGIRAACRDFTKNDSGHAHTARSSNGLSDFELNQHLGEMRRSIGFHVAAICVKYGIDVEDQLAVILPEQYE